MDRYKRFFIGSIKEKYPDRVAEIIKETDQHFNAILPDVSFAENSKNPMDKRLVISAYFLAFIKTLDRLGEPFDAIRKVCHEIAQKYVTPRNKIQAAARKLLPKLINTWPARMLLKIFSRKVARLSHPNGFRTQVITSKEETFGLGFGFDILECGICKLYQKHHYQKYTSILCEVDEITSSLAGLKLERKGTIALGASKCDFRFRRRGA